MAVTITDELHQSTSQGRLPRVLVIDDDTANGLLLYRIFAEDHLIDCVTSGRDGLNAIAQTAYDVVLLDIMMPDMNGFAVLEALRGVPETAELPVILISSLSDSDHVVRGLRLGANDYVAKPLNAHVVRARVSTQVKIKRLMDERKQSLAQMEKLYELREHFFHIATHDLKNPLSHLRLASHELSFYTPVTPETLTLQGVMEGAMRQMQALIEDFMEAAALNNGKLDIKLQPIDVNDLVNRVVDLYLMMADQKSISVAVEHLAGVVMADQDRLIQVIGNLISNAIKYSPPRTCVRVWTEQRNDLLRILVADQGPGIPVNEHGQLFKEFSKLSPRPTGDESSTGLGLWIVKQLAVMMHGTVGLDSPPEGGSIFWIELPLCDVRVL